MILVHPSHRVINKGVLTPAEFVEMVGRTCYKSTDKIEVGSAEKFIKGLVNRKHYAMLEHFWVHCLVKDSPDWFFVNIGGLSTKYTVITITPEGNLLFSAPIRVLLEWADQCREADRDYPVILDSCIREYPEFFPNEIRSGYYRQDNFSWFNEDDFAGVIEKELACINPKKEILEKELRQHLTHTVVFVCDRGVSHELVRHRACSFAQESQRYCNYSKDKFSNQVSFIVPPFFKRNPETQDSVMYDDSDYSTWLMACEYAEKSYFELIEKGHSPQEARTVLPNSVKTEIIVTANEEEWQHIFDLRVHGTTGAPHPQMLEVMKPCYEDLKHFSSGRLK